MSYAELTSCYQNKKWRFKKKHYFGCAANHSSAANVASSMLENFLPLRCFLSDGLPIAGV
jgi:hypothetical protein